jgi:hypothetical protein
LGEKSSEEKKKKKPWLHRPLFLSPIGQILAHKEKCCLDGRSELQKPFKEKIINENRSLFARYLWHVFGKTIFLKQNILLQIPWFLQINSLKK